MAQIPMAADVAEVIGKAAERVENRGLLLDKFVFHKSWPVAKSDHGRDVKWDKASRWSLIRIADGAAEILGKEAEERERRGRGNNVRVENQTRFQEEAKLLRSLAKVSWENKEVATLRRRHTGRFLGLFRSAYKERALMVVGQLKGRLAINLSSSLIQNAGASLDKLFGMPFIPGSAIKGSARHAALAELKAATGEDRRTLFGAFRTVFGTADNDFQSKKQHSHGDLASFRDLVPKGEENIRGAFSFLPAYPINDARLVVDLTNVHYPRYYEEGNVENLAEESPQPNAFPVVEVGAQFAFCLVANKAEIAPATFERAKHWLEQALTVFGLGAKTAAGYGWFSLQPEVLEQIEQQERAAAEQEEKRLREEEAARSKRDEEERRLGAMPPEDAARERLMNLKDEEFAKKASELGSLPPEEQKGLVMALTTPKKKDTWKNWKKSDKPANKSRVELIRAAASKHQINLP